MISSGIMNVKPLITHRYSFKNVIEAFQFASKMPEDAIKVMIQM
jgi:D-xylulose reductase